MAASDQLNIAHSEISALAVGWRTTGHWTLQSTSSIIEWWWWCNQANNRLQAVVALCPFVQVPPPSNLCTDESALIEAPYLPPSDAPSARDGIVIRVTAFISLIRL